MPKRKRSVHASRAALGPGALIACYLRDSGGAAQGLSVSQQRAALAAYAGQRQWIISRWYADAAQSGATDDRPALQQLLADCRQGDPGYVAVLTWATSRFGRDTLESQFNRLWLRRQGVDVLSANPAEATPDGATAVVFEAMFDWKNQQFLEDMSRDVRRGLRANVVAGYAPGGTPPRGYLAEPVTAGIRRDGKPKIVARWVMDPELGPRVSQAFRLFADGASYAEIHAATRLYKSDSCYASMLRNRSYLGVLKFGSEEFPDMIPALVDQATFAQVQARIAAGAAYTPRPGSDYLLSGLLRCGYCDGPMAGGVDRRNERRGYRAWRYYKCDRKRRLGAAACPDQRHVGADQLEDRVVNLVLDRILTPACVREIYEEIGRRFAGPDLAAEISGLEDQIVGVRRSVANILDLVERAGADETTLARLTQRRTELAQLTARRDEQARRQAIFGTPPTPAEIEAILATLRQGIASEEVDVARRTLRAFVEQVVVKGAELRIDYRADAVLALGEVPPRGQLAGASMRLSLVVT